MIELVGREHGHDFGVERHGILDELGAFGRAREGAERDVDLVGDQERHALRRLRRHPLDLHATRASAILLPTSMSKPSQSPLAPRALFGGKLG